MPERAPDEVLRDPERLDALRRFGLLDTAPEEAFDRFTRLAAAVLDAPVALLSLVDDERQFFKSHVGLDEPWASKQETPLTHSFCQFAVSSGRPLVVEDARTHELLQDNLAITHLGVIAYCGVPLVTSEGKVLGAFCVIDGRPRRWSERDVRALSDLTASLMAEIELRELAGTLAGQTQDVQDWFTALAHDIRSPLASIAAAGSTIRDLDAVGEAAKTALLDIVVRQAERLLGYVDRIVEDARDRDLGSDRPPEPVDVIRRAEQIAEELAPSSPGARIAVSGAGVAAADAQAVGRILINLVTNAIKHGGPEVAIDISVRRDRDEIVLEVSDDGPGIAADLLPRIFDRYRQGAEASGGAGLGLFHVRTLTEAQGGRVEVSSTPGAGARFRVTLPAWDGGAVRT